MKKGLIILGILFTITSVQATKIRYFSPKPDAIMISCKTNIILGYQNDINEATLSDALVNVVGSQSGMHRGELILSDDGKTLIFNPNNAFAANETVNVQVQEGIQTLSGHNIELVSFQFSTAPLGIIQENHAGFTDLFSNDDLLSPHTQKALTASASLPAPPISIDSVDTPSSGHIFMATWDRNMPHLYGNYIFVLDSCGGIVDSLRVEGAPFDLQVQPNGLLSYAAGGFAGIVPGAGESLRHLILDNTLTVVDSFSMKNGYTTDFHEFLLLPNGHAMMMAYHTILYDMSQIVEGGKTNASLVINVIQEQDADKNVVFEWRNIDYIPITDTDLDLTASRINYGTLNAFTLDNDGNILASFRNHSEIMKINRGTGEVMWRWGSPRSEFTFMDEHEDNAPFYFSRQHHIQRLANGNVSLFDNGQFHTPPYSRAVEYALDETQKTATLISEFRYPSENIFAAAAGNAQKLSNGGWFIGYGILAPPSPVKRNIVETKGDGSIALEISLPQNVIAYRASKALWKGTVKNTAVTLYELLEGNTYTFSDASQHTGVTIRYQSLVYDFYNDLTVERRPTAPANPQFFGIPPRVWPVTVVYTGSSVESHISEIHINLDRYTEIRNPRTTSIYFRPQSGAGLFLKQPTTYDSLNHELVATLNDFGEIIFGDIGYAYSANPPIPYEPANHLQVLPQDSIIVRWTGKGKADQFRVQISADSLFGTTLVDSTLKLSSVALHEIANHSTYFWRVQSQLGAQQSAWSSVWSFSTTDPFLDLKSPKGNETWPLGSTQMIRWETNISDTVSIALYTAQQPAATIGKVPGDIGAFAWPIATDLPPSSEYRIHISSLADANLTATSTESFSLIDTSSTGIDEGIHSIPDKFVLHQNFPNPFNPETTIHFDLPKQAFATLKIYNIKGILVATAIQRQMAAGRYQVQFSAEELASGIYFYTLESGEFRQCRKMIYVK